MSIGSLLRLSGDGDQKQTTRWDSREGANITKSVSRTFGGLQVDQESYVRERLQGQDRVPRSNAMTDDLRKRRGDPMHVTLNITYEGAT
jgi:hypothetical protein